MKLTKKNSLIEARKKFKLKGVQSTEIQTEDTVQKRKPKEKSGLSKYSDEYRPLTDSVKFVTRQFETVHGSPCRDHLEVSVKRLGGNDEENPVCVFLQMFKESERYTGPAKGRTVYFPVEHIGEVIRALQSQLEQCGEQGLKNE